MDLKKDAWNTNDHGSKEDVENGKKGHKESDEDRCDLLDT